MELDDRVTIATPEGIELELQLAGLGSRFIAGTVDLIIQVVVIVLLALAAGAASGTSLNAVALIIGVFLVWFFYPIAFELLNRGRTPGKMLAHLRVVRESGAPVDLAASSVRNLMRVIDGPLLSYLPTVISIAVTARNQRPGDLAAGTLVVRESPAARSRPARRGPRARGRAATAPPAAPAEPGELPSWDVTAITAGEVAAARRFLERRASLDRTARAQLAHRLAAGLVAKTAGAPEAGDPERFLETLVELKSRRG